MKTIKEVIELSCGFLEGKKVERARRIAEELLSHVLKLKKMELYLRFDQPVVEEELVLLRESLKRVAKGEPIEYVMGEVEFFGCKIKVDKRVLIPRPETEILVEMVAKKVKKGTLLDLCTGSGCIGIALKKACPELTVIVSDISPDALTLAAENARLNQVEVELVQGDFLEPFKARHIDTIVCNPPYISEAEYRVLAPSVRDFEPKLALLGGTEFYERLKKDLSPRVNCFLEIGSTQSSAIQQIFENEGQILNDWAGLPRFFFLEKQGFL